MCDGAIKVEEELGLNPLYETRIPLTHSTIPRLTSIKGVGALQLLSTSDGARSETSRHPSNFEIAPMLLGGETH